MSLYNGILFSLKTEEILAICNKIDEPGRHYAEEINNTPEINRHRKTNTVWSHLYVESKIFKFMKAECKKVFFQGLEGGGMGRCSKGTQIQLFKFWRSNIQHGDYS